MENSVSREKNMELLKGMQPIDEVNEIILLGIPSPIKDYPPPPLPSPYISLTNQSIIKKSANIEIKRLGVSHCF